MAKGNNALTVGIDALACETSALSAELGMLPSAEAWQICGKCYALNIGQVTLSIWKRRFNDERKSGSDLWKTGAKRPDYSRSKI